jgi:hypothetical protein
MLHGPDAMPRPYTITQTTGENMATMQSFKVSKKNIEAVEVTRELPETLDDPAWAEIVSKHPEDVHDLALQSWVIKAQAAARGRLEEGNSAQENTAEAQDAVGSYVFGARTGGFTRPKISKSEAKSLGFTKAQLSALAALGVKMVEDAA